MCIGSICCRTLCVVTATFATSANERSLPPARLDLRNVDDENSMQTCAEHQCPRHANVACMPVSVRACGRHLSSGCQMPAWLVEPPLSVPAPPSICFFFLFFLASQEHFRGKFRSGFFKDEGSGAQGGMARPTRGRRRTTGASPPSCVRRSLSRLRQLLYKRQRTSRA